MCSLGERKMFCGNSEKRDTLSCTLSIQMIVTIEKRTRDAEKCLGDALEVLILFCTESRK